MADLTERLRYRHRGGQDADALLAANEIDRLRKIEAAARNLVAQKGRHHTEQAYQRLAALLVPNVK